MVHKLEQGKEIIAKQKKADKVVKVESEDVSSIVTNKGHELFEQKLIGDLVLV